MKDKRVPWFIIFAFLVWQCTGVERGCSSCAAENLGADWVVVQFSVYDGKPIRCWELEDVSITNEPNSDGIYWRDNFTGNLIHISGSYNRVMVVNGRWDAAFFQVGITKQACKAVRMQLYSVPTSSER